MTTTEIYRIFHPASLIERRGGKEELKKKKENVMRGRV